jgi:cytochrome c2
MASSLELNKLLAGVLTAGIIAVGAAVFSGILYRPQPLEEHAFNVVVPEDEGAASADAEAETADEPALPVLLASADPSAGEAITRQCAACHVFNEGGENRVGPALWDVVGRDIASVDGFAYSEALQGKEGDWTYEKLDAFLAAPREWAPGTSMSYAGLRNATDRANLIAYMRGQSNDPVPLPDASAAAEAAAEPAAEAAPPTDEAAAEETAAEEPATEAAEAAAEPAAEEVAAAEEPAAEETAEAEAPAEAESEMAAAAETTSEAAADETTETAVTESAETEAAAEGPGAEAPAAETAGGSEASPMVAMVADADPAAGERTFRQCAACHTPDKGGQNRVGPNLWGVFGADIGSHEGFNYSDALTSIDGIWTVEKLNAYLENPRGFAPGNRMAFAGLRNEADRAAMIAYLHSLSDDPKPLDVQ